MSKIGRRTIRVWFPRKQNDVRGYCPYRQMGDMCHRGVLDWVWGNVAPSLRSSLWVRGMGSKRAHAKGACLGSAGKIETFFAWTSFDMVLR